MHLLRNGFTRMKMLPPVAICVVILFASGDSVGQANQESSMPSDSEIRQILVDRIDVQQQSVGIVVGVIGPEGRRIIAYGHLEKGDPRPLNGDTDV